MVDYRAATPENPAFDLNSPDAWDAFGVQRAATGQPVSAESALTWDAWYRGVTLLALYIAKTPLHVWKKVKRPTGDGRVMADDHTAYGLLRWQANEAQTAFQLQLALAGHAINRGNGYAYIWRAGPDPVELTLLDPDRTSIIPKTGGQWYKTRIDNEDRRIPAADILHVKGFGFDGFQGYPAFSMAKEAIGLGDAQQKFKAIRYRNKAEPGVILESPNFITPQVRQETREDWERMHSGLQNSHRTAVLGSGLKASKLSFTAVEMQEVEQAGLSIRQAANFLGLPSSKLGDVAGIKYASKEQDDLAFLNDGLDFWFCSIEDEARSKLLLESEKKSGDYSILFDRTQIAKGDSTARSAYLRTALGGQPWMTQNEARKEEGLEAHDDPTADELKTPLNMGQGGDKNQPEDVSQPGPGNPKKPGAIEAAASDSLADATRRMVRRVASGAMRAAKDAGKFVAWVDAIKADHGEVIREALGPAERMLAALGMIADVGTVADALTAQLAAEFDAVSNSATPANLATAVESLTTEQERRIPAFLASKFLGANS